MSIGTAIYAIALTAFVLYLVFQLIDSERERKFNKALKRMKIEKDFESEMQEIRTDWGGEHFGEIRMKVKKNSKKSA